MIPCDSCGLPATTTLAYQGRALGKFCHNHAGEERKAKALELTNWAMAAKHSKQPPKFRRERVYELAYQAVRGDSIE